MVAETTGMVNLEVMAAEDVGVVVVEGLFAEIM